MGNATAGGRVSPSRIGLRALCRVPYLLGGRRADHTRHSPQSIYKAVRQRGSDSDFSAPAGQYPSLGLSPLRKGSVRQYRHMLPGSVAANRQGWHIRVDGDCIHKTGLGGHSVPLRLGKAWAAEGFQSPLGEAAGC